VLGVWDGLFCGLMSNEMEFLECLRTSLRAGVEFNQKDLLLCIKKAELPLFDSKHSLP